MRSIDAETTRSLDDLRRMSVQLQRRTDERDALLARLHSDGVSIPVLAEASGMSVGKAHSVSKRALRVVTSVGYEGRTIDEFVASVLSAGIDRVVDVRELPLSRRKGFSKTALGANLEEAGVEYQHVRDLGNPKDNRDGFRAGRRTAIRRFESILAGPAAPAVDQLRETISERRIALLCFEREHSTCHRSSITRFLQADDPYLAVHEI